MNKRELIKELEDKHHEVNCKRPSCEDFFVEAHYA